MPIKKKLHYYYNIQLKLLVKNVVWYNYFYDIEYFKLTKQKVFILFLVIYFLIDLFAFKNCIIKFQ